MFIIKNLPFIYFFTSGIILSIYDIKTLHIPLWILYVGMFISIIINIVFFNVSFIERIISAFCVFLFYLIIYITKKGIGFGDVQYSFYCGLFLDLPNFIFSTLVSTILAIIFYFLKSFIINKKDFRIPFVPFMYAGCIIIIFFQYYSTTV